MQQLAALQVCPALEHLHIQDLAVWAFRDEPCQASLVAQLRQQAHHCQGPAEWHLFRSLRRLELEGPLSVGARQLPSPEASPSRGWVLSRAAGRVCHALQGCTMG